jgi:acyl-CoA thioester hydrolase
MPQAVKPEATMSRTAPVIHRTTVRQDWVDYNGHMNDACYGIVFSHAVDDVIDAIGLDAAYRTAHARSMFTLETHVCYLREAKLGESLRVTQQLLGYDGKRLHVFLAMYRNGDDTLLATSEQMLLHVDMAGPRAVPFDAPILACIETMWAEHAQLELPRQAGRTFRPLERSRLVKG